ncbi:hypothetical protein Z517_00208 [Fonsecaea pedrosoi CBS 271.37]|uniref:Poly [ADP-ribose] polymerase n=1 Tax=Fonsecaea pedrosoi CBS 271.37 TaxID=1442368 RepID=A0A0D2H1R3_9EURO|nr:uncharacterized protein Z517_00208 [Fonsecaea pedrosoi CBS 271.37]KIW84820.1 hypothetical protein Z517_00208 [Fonsecaea pedrosoi CBS 271.37]
MQRLWAPDPSGTINPAKLTQRAVGVTPLIHEDVDVLCNPPPIDAQETTNATGQDDLTTSSTLPAPSIPRPSIPLPRICSDWEGYDTFLSESERYQEYRLRFEALYIPKKRPSTARSRCISHHGYFRSQTWRGKRLHIPRDPKAGFDATVVIDRGRMSIYDVYLLRVDIMKNINSFRRHQVVYYPETETYAFYTREGRVGLEGRGRVEIESNCFTTVADRFRKSFHDETYSNWTRRYEALLRCYRKYAFVELDYHKTTASLLELPTYTTINAKVNEEVKDLMEYILFGGPASSRPTSSENPSASRSWLAFTAPYEQLSSWAVFSAFKTLEYIRKHIESGNAINWMTILRLSSLYRSQIPFCCAEDRPPVISSYHALFLEAKFLYCLWPQQEIAAMAKAMHCRGSLQLDTHKTLAQPLYQAYSSLRHGFRRLTDSSTTEFRQLRNYLERSCHHIHCLNVELEDIYRLFVKAQLPNPYRDWIESKQTVSDPSGSELRVLLWHGTALDSLLGILELGLQVRRPGATWTGTMFGNAIYLADASSKSAGFCKSDAWGGQGILLLCEADIGGGLIRSTTSIYNGHEIINQSGGRYRCIQGLGRTGPSRWREVDWELDPPLSGRVPLIPETRIPYGHTHSRGILGFNEYALYDPSHVLLRYLFRVKIKRRFH